MRTALPESPTVFTSGDRYALANTVESRGFCGPGPTKFAAMATERVMDGPIAVVGVGYIGHLFVQHLALAGRSVRASARTLPDRLRDSITLLAEMGLVEAVEASTDDETLARVSVHEDLATAAAP
jgi:hypothetical protein